MKIRKKEKPFSLQIPKKAIFIVVASFAKMLSILLYGSALITTRFFFAFLHKSFRLKLSSKIFSLEFLYLRMFLSQDMNMMG
jgi:hypothetical protein